MYLIKQNIFYLLYYIYYLNVFHQLPRAVNTQTLSGAGFLKIITRATDAVSKMTIKMNESDIVCQIQLDSNIFIQTLVVSILRFFVVAGNSVMVNC